MGASRWYSAAKQRSIRLTPSSLKGIALAAARKGKGVLFFGLSEIQIYGVTVTHIKETIFGWHNFEVVFLRGISVYRMPKLNHLGLATLAMAVETRNCFVWQPQSCG